MFQVMSEISVSRIAELLFLRHAIVMDKLLSKEAHEKWELCDKDFWEKQVLTVLETIKIGE